MLTSSMDPPGTGAVDANFSPSARQQASDFPYSEEVGDVEASSRGCSHVELDLDLLKAEP